MKEFTDGFIKPLIWDDETKCMPYIKGSLDENMYRVNNCPSCGKYVRDVMI
jgi:hypothetical protein